MVGFITAWSLWSVTRLPVEVALIDPKVALIRYGITFIVPPAAGLIAFFLEKSIL
jgi:virulence-associated protein VagC